MSAAAVMFPHLQLTVSNRQIEVTSGLHSTCFRATPGQVKVLLTRNGKEIARLVCPEWITDKPYRTDRLTYSFSNQSTDFYKTVFGESPILYSEEYNPAAADNKISCYHSEALQ